MNYYGDVDDNQIRFFRTHPSFFVGSRSTKGKWRVFSKVPFSQAVEIANSLLASTAPMFDGSTPNGSRVVCGSIPEFSCYRFFSEISDLVEGVERGKLLGNGFREVVATKGNELHIKKFIDSWLKETTDENGAAAPKWMIGVTAVPKRMDMLKTSLQSLYDGGFGRPTVFFDSAACPVDLPDHEIVFRGSNIRTYGHWILTLLELYIRDPYCDRYAIFQDDVLCYRNTRQYLDTLLFPSQGYWNLYTGTFSIQNANVTNEEIIQNADVGFVESNQRGHGAQGLVFSNHAVSLLFRSESMFSRLWNPMKRHCSVDGFVVTALKAHGWKEYIHAPTLLQHIGETSSMGHGTQPKAKSFLGESFDAMSFLKAQEDSVSYGLGTLIGNALKIFGIDDAVVTNWLGRPCGCEERRKKLDALTAWARRSLFRGFANAKQSLADLIVN